MATIGSVNAVFTASVGGLTSGVDAASKAFKALGGDTSTLRSALKELDGMGKQNFLDVGPAATAAREAFQQISEAAAKLGADFRAGAIRSTEFANGMAALTAQARQMASATADAAAITRENTTESQDYFAALDRIANAVRNGGLAEDVAARARDAALKTYISSADAIRQQTDALGGLQAATAAVGNIGPIKLAVEASGLASIDDLKAALVGVDGKTVQLAVEASGLGSIEALKAAIGGVDGKAIDLAVQASGLGSIEALKSALAGVGGKEVTLAVQASGLGSVEALKAAIESVNVDTLYGELQGVADAFAADTAAALGLASATATTTDALAAAAAASVVANAAEEERQAMMARAAEITKSMASAASVHAAALDELDVLYGAGLLSLEAYNAASAREDEILANADGSAAAAARSLSELAAAHERGASVTRANMTAAELYAYEIADLKSLLSVGAINQQTFDRATASAAARMRDGGAAANQMAAGLNQMSGGLSGVTSRLNALIGLNIAQLFGSLASTISNAVGSVIRMGQAEAGVIDQTSKLAARVGVTYGEMAGLSLAAQKVGVDLKSVGDATTKADVAFVRAAQGSQTAIDAFAGIGLSLKDLNGLSTADRFEAISVSISKLPTEAERAAAAVEIFGRSGADLLPLFNNGAEGIRAAREEADRLGLSLTTAQGNDVQKMVSSFEAAQTAVQGIVQQVTAYLSPAITGVIEQFNAWVANIGGANIGQAIGDGILVGAEYLAGVADWLVANFNTAVKYFSDVGVQWASVSDMASRTAAAILLPFRTIYNTFEIIGNIVGGIISNTVAGLLNAAANVAGLIPGLKGVADSLRSGADTAESFTASYNAAITKNANDIGNAFGAVFGESKANQFGQAIAKPITSILQRARETAQQSAKAIEDTKQKPVEIKQKVEVGITQALKAIDSRSQQGISEYFRILRGDTGNVQEKQLEVLQTIADNTSGMEELPAVGLAGA